MSSTDNNNPEPSSETMIPPPPPAHNASWRLLSQGAEARLWLVPDFLSVSSPSSNTTDSNATTNSNATRTAAVCKERFPKSYRHPTLDATITKSRTKGEARCLVRCRRGGVPCPAILGVDAGTTTTTTTTASAANKSATASSGSVKNSSSCIYLEHIEGCTIRQYFETRAHGVEDEKAFLPKRDSDDEKDDEVDQSADDESEDSYDGIYWAGPAFNGPALKKWAKSSGSSSISHASGVSGRSGKSNKSGVSDKSGKSNASGNTGTRQTRVDEEAMQIATALGHMVADMHNVNIVHGDLTTSNCMLRNPPPSSSAKNHSGKVDKDTSDATMAASVPEWKPRLVLIDFGLSGTAGNKGVSHEEKAVDLYVLERAFEATHPGSRTLVEEVLRAYKGRCKTSDSVLQRLAQVRMRGRKRECFG